MIGMDTANEELNQVRKENPGTALKFVPDLEFLIEERMEDLLDEIGKDIDIAAGPEGELQEQEETQRSSSILTEPRFKSAVDLLRSKNKTDDEIIQIISQGL